MHFCQEKVLTLELFKKLSPRIKGRKSHVTRIMHDYNLDRQSISKEIKIVFSGKVHSEVDIFFEYQVLANIKRIQNLLVVLVCTHHHT